MDPKVSSSLISGVGSFLGSLVNFFTGRATNKSNEAINQRNLDYQKAITQEAWERDDSAYQRQVADLQKAGLSPLAATSGGAGVSSPLGAPSPIAMQAPQLDINGALEAALGFAQLDRQKRKDSAEISQAWQKLANEGEEIKLKSDSLTLENKKLEETIKHHADLIKLQSDELSEAERHNKELEEIQKIVNGEVKRHNLKQEELDNGKLTLEKLSFQSQEFYKEVKAQAGGDDVPYHVYHDYAEYQNAVKLRNAAYSRLIDNLGATSSSVSSSKSKGDSASLGVTFLGSGTSSSSSKSRSESESTSVNLSARQQALLDKFYKDYPVPVYLYGNVKPYNANFDK